MSSKAWVWGGAAIGSTVGSILPYFWNGDWFSYSLWGTIGAIVGIWCGFKLAKATGAF